MAHNVSLFRWYIWQVCIKTVTCFALLTMLWNYVLNFGTHAYLIINRANVKIQHIRVNFIPYFIENQGTKNWTLLYQLITIYNIYYIFFHLYFWRLVFPFPFGAWIQMVPQPTIEIGLQSLKTRWHSLVGKKEEENLQCGIEILVSIHVCIGHFLWDSEKELEGSQHTHNPFLKP